MKDQRTTPIVYVIVDDPEYENRVLFYHLIDRAEAAHLRCLMTLLMLPSDLAGLDNDNPVFLSAYRRLTIAPLIIRAPADRNIDKKSQIYLQNAPLVILLVNGRIPEWAKDLAKTKPLGLLTPSEEVATLAKKENNFQIGLLKEFSDILESYKILQYLISSYSMDKSITPYNRQLINNIIKKDLLKDRPRLSFIPGIPLPNPDKGRSIVYLINRLSNNVDKPALMNPAQDDVDKGINVFLRILEVSFVNCAVFASIEIGTPIINNISLSASELKKHHDFFLSDAPDDQKFGSSD